MIDRDSVSLARCLRLKSVERASDTAVVRPSTEASPTPAMPASRDNLRRAGKGASVNVRTRELLAPLLEATADLKFEPHDISHALDRTGRYEIELDREFLFTIKLFHYTSEHFTRGATWHERLEIFLPLDGDVRFRIGDQELLLQRGDLLVVDNLKLHQVVDFPEFNARVVVVSFMREFVYSLGSPAHDHSFLLPFDTMLEGRPHVLRPGDPQARDVYRDLAELVRCYCRRPRLFEIACKAVLLRILHRLAVRFESSEAMRADFLRQQERTQRLRKLLAHIESHYAERLALADAARMVGMSTASFIKVFKQVAGMTFVTYVTHVRLSRAAQWLRDGTRSMAEIAIGAGFTDQSYFVRQFRKHFGQTPSAYRRAHTVRPL